MFDIAELKKETKSHNRYERRLAKLVAQTQEVERIKTVVTSALTNVRNGRKSFVIYGEPQSGKTEMMIALTAKLLDEDFKIIIVLLNDSVQLLGQNLERFQRSGLSPSPKKFSEIISGDIVIGDHSWVIFCKKNSSDLQKLLLKLSYFDRKVIIDDEADYATPNSKINKQEKSKINELTERLIGKDGIYIGVTATPARLDLNRTHNNENESWIDFPPHSNYTGQEIFFPSNFSARDYRLVLLPDKGDDPKYLRDALFRFMVTVAFLNTEINSEDTNYSMLIHTSGKKEDHNQDYRLVNKTFEALREEAHKNHKKYYERIWYLASEVFPENVDQIIRYIYGNRDRNNVVVMNSDKERNAADNRTATDPTAPFTIVIGGNIVSRGVTFINLLSMFFTRDVKHNIQQDTYIQRARMFGSRGVYLKYFELTIPQQLYLDWQRCFIFHRLSLDSRRLNNNSPIWLEGERVSAVATSSVNKAVVVIDKGEMSFEMFKYNEPDILEVLEENTDKLSKVRALSELLGTNNLPSYLIEYIKNFCPGGESSIAIHYPKSITGYKDISTDQSSITRTKGFIGRSQLEQYPNAIHHINIFYNDEGNAKVFYKYHGNVRFLKSIRLA